MRSTKQFFKVFLLIIPMLLLSTVVVADVVDDDIPEVTDRVARISFIRGEVQIRRADSEDWEQAVLNLPIVEGDEITTAGDARIEIQFNTYTHVRLAENSYLRVVHLQDSGIAVSLPQGRLTLRAMEFDPEAAYFEIDAPKTTVSVLKPGMYSVDAREPGSSEVRVSATEGGEARVYTASAGFTVKDGRVARIFVEGQFAGEWQSADAGTFSDEFDEWSLERDVVIAQRLRNAHYDEYYDRDLYGAEELNDYGEWVHTRQYGYVWRPHRNSVSQYADWSPYRYGHWRWIPAFGWTWVNDEPWGWTTYHHGRWFWDSGHWYWSPYGYARGHRSWWRPALVVITIIRGNICWYPLGYGYAYYDYNYHHRRRRGGRVRYNPPAAVPSPTPFRGRLPSPTALERKPGVNLPPNGVVTVAASEFGRKKGGYQTAPPEMASEAVKPGRDDQQSPPLLPSYEDLNGKIDPAIRAASPLPSKVRVQPPTGAAERKSAVPLDQELRKERIQGGRAPLQINTGRGEVKVPRSDEPVRDTGAVTRPERKPVRRVEEPVRTPPIYSPPVRQAPVVTEPAKPRVERQPEPVRPQPAPRYDPPKPRSEPVRQAPPTRNSPPPRSEPTKKSDPPPQKNEPSKPAESKRKNG